MEVIVPVFSAMKPVMDADIIHPIEPKRRMWPYLYVFPYLSVRSLKASVSSRGIIGLDEKPISNAPERTSINFKENGELRRSGIPGTADSTAPSIMAVLKNIISLL